MGEVVAVIKIMPNGVDVDLENLPEMWIYRAVR